MSRDLLLVTHTGRPGAVRSAQLVAERLVAADVTVLAAESEADALACPGVSAVPGGALDRPVELVMVLGGDGTILRAAETARPVGAPVLGVNLGRVGFLAEAERADLTDTVDRVLARDYVVEERTTLAADVLVDGHSVGDGWALNDVTVEKAARRLMLDVIVEVDGRPLSRWGCDGVICATPTGSTAYAFSAGGPVVWPDVEALLMVPISAHALFSRPLVTAPTSVLAVELLDGPAEAVLWCDGRRMLDVPAGARVEVRRSAQPVRLARLTTRPFTDRLVAKFGLPVGGWRGRLDP